MKFEKQEQSELPWQPWKIVKLGTHKDIRILYGAIENEGMKVANSASYMASFTHDDVRVSRAETNITLTRMTVADIGFTNEANLDDIYAKSIGKITIVDGKKYKVFFCSNEVVPQLRLQYAKQPEKEWLRIAMKTIKTTDGHRRLFNVVHYYLDVPVLTGDEATLFGCHDVFVFGLSESGD
ncbi:MAG: hypothetical protein WCL28_14305 [bacterium]